MSSSVSQAAPSAVISLKKENLERIGERIQTPDYDIDNISCGIVHMSLGGFHRSHQALYTDDVLNIDNSWGICGIGMMPDDLDNTQILNSQDNLYTVLERSAEMDVGRVIGSIREVMHAPSSPADVINKLSDPAIKILSLTITEKGYFYDESGELNTSHPAVKNDLENPQSPQTAMGYIYAALKKRKENGAGPMTVMSCDNLPGNGDLAKKILLQHTQHVDEEFKSWIEENVSFPNAMVDRITPITTSEVVEKIRSEFGVEDGWPVVCEDFRQWVLEDKFVAGRPAWEEAGVQLVPDVEPYEKMKVRLLNGSHSALSYISYLMGYRDVDLALADPLIDEFVRSYMNEDITPCIPDVPGVDLDEYKETLIRRFANPGVRDQVQRLAEDGSSKIPNSILPCLRYQLENEGSIKWICLALAGWFRYLSAIDEELNPIMIKDPLSEKLISAAKVEAGDPVHLLGIEEIFGSELRNTGRVVAEIREAWQSLIENGTRATLRAYLSN